MENELMSDVFLQYVAAPEKAWIDSLIQPFGSHHITDDKRFEVFVLNADNHHPQFNPFCSMIFYIQRTHIGEIENQYNTRKNGIYYVNQPMYRPTGVLVMDHGSQVVSCLDGYLHNSSGNPAMSSGLFGSAYYLHGSCYEAFEYFSMMEDQRKYRPQWFSYTYPDYDPRKYIEFMASTLGSRRHE